MATASSDVRSNVETVSQPLPRKLRLVSAAALCSHATAMPASTRPAKAVERKPAFLHQPDQGRDEGLRLGVAEGEADDPLAAEQPVDIEGDLGAERRGAHDDQGAPGGERVDALAQHADVAGGLDQAVGAPAAGDVGERPGEVGSGRVDGVGGSQLPCQ